MYHCCDNLTDKKYCQDNCRKKHLVYLRRIRLKELSVAYLGNKCALCGYSKYIGSLDFHHIDPSKKEYGISSSGITRSWSKTKEELEKCILICKNCHGEIHAKLHESIDLLDLAAKQKLEGIDLETELPKGSNLKIKIQPVPCQNCGTLRTYSQASNLCKVCVKEKFQITKEELETLVLKISITKIAKLFNVDRKTIIKRCNKYNIQKPQRLSNIPDKFKQYQQEKFQITKEELEKLVWEKPTSEIAKEFGVSDNAIGKRCKKHNIQKPPRGYWQKINPYQNKNKGA